MSELHKLTNQHNIESGNWVPINTMKRFHGVTIYYRATGERMGEYILVDSDGTTCSGPFTANGAFNSMLSFAARADGISSIARESMVLA